MHDHFTQFARYNGWANRLLYTSAAQLSDEEYRRDVGLFFGSIHATLNHILVADEIWMARLTGTTGAPTSLDVILHETFDDLLKARKGMDERIIDYTNGLTSEDFTNTFTYTPVTNPEAVTQARAPVLAHLFNHQTHHRGQVHAAMTHMGHDAPSLDLIYFQRVERLAAL
ncbi:DinB family protein [Ahrensia sp. R2A130]|uniref:DinB family protein n=1 Tax=Ahrensia sp. R2A130 TaxID=744979 RepID=UPI0001E09429|nr:DinB family protein [Ahrensia sp. R2A130]EFL90586.1 DinB family protein [Ahrensia sp. R2A130]